MKSGIYAIINLITNDEYIGSAKNLINRKYEHFRNLKKNTHHNIFLQRAFNKYGKQNFIFKNLMLCDETDLIKNENNFFNIRKPKYNICPVANSRLGTKHNDETKNKISIKAKKRDFNIISKNLLHRTKNKNANAKIKDDNIYHQMCEDIKKGNDLKLLAIKYSVDYKVVLRARKGLVDVEIRKHKGKKLSADENKKFIIDYNSGVKTKHLAIKYGLHKSSVYNKIKKIKTPKWRDA